MVVSGVGSGVGSGAVPTMVPGGSEDLGADCGLVPVVPEIPAWCFRCDSGMVFNGLIIHRLA